MLIMDPRTVKRYTTDEAFQKMLEHINNQITSLEEARSDIIKTRYKHKKRIKGV